MNVESVTVLTVSGRTTEFTDVTHLTDTNGILLVGTTDGMSAFPLANVERYDLKLSEPEADLVVPEPSGLIVP